jgi:hypothetical protein
MDAELKHIQGEYLMLSLAFMVCLPFTLIGFLTVVEWFTKH